MQLADSVSANLQPDLLTGTGDIEDYRILIIRSLAALADWKEEWNRLWSARRNGTVFQHFAWAEAWIESFGERGEMCVVVAADDKRPARARAILPLWAREDGEFHLVGEPRADYQDLVCAGDAEEIDSLLPPMLTRVAGSRRGWTRIVFNELREDSVLLGSLRRLESAGKLPFAACEQVSSHCPVVELAGQGGVLDGLLRKKSLRRHYNAMAKMPGFRYRRIESPDEAQTILDALVEQHMARWAIRGERSLFAEQSNVDFYRRLIASAAFFPLLHFVVVEVDGRPVSTHLGFLHEGTFVWYKPSFDPNFERNSPGEVIMFCLLREFQQSGLEEFDFTRGEESFKSRFATAVRKNHRVTMFASSFDKAIYSLKDKLRNAEQGGALIRHLAPVLYTVVGFIRRLAKHRHEGGAEEVGSGAHEVPVSAGGEVRVFRFEGPDELPALPRGLEAVVGPVDLLALGKWSVLRPEYLSAARLQLAVKRKYRGDRILVIKNSVGVPVHFSWLRSAESGASNPDIGENLSADGDNGIEIIFDFWTATDAAEYGLSSWAMRKLGNEVARDGKKAWLYCGSSDSDCRRAAEQAGFTLLKTVSSE